MFNAVIPTYTLTALVSPTLGGSVTPDPPGWVHDAGTPVQLTANPSPGYLFARWSGDLAGTVNPDTITMTQDLTVTAHFQVSGVPTYTLAALISPPGSGQVTLDPPGGVYEENTPVQLTALPTAGYAFAVWSGDLTGTISVATVTMTRDVSVTANFALTQFQVYLPLVLKR